MPSSALGSIAPQYPKPTDCSAREGFSTLAATVPRKVRESQRKGSTSQTSLPASIATQDSMENIRSFSRRTAIAGTDWAAWATF